MVIILILYVIIEKDKTLRDELLVGEIPHNVRKAIEVLAIENVVVNKICKVVDKGIYLADFEEDSEIGD